MAKRSKMRFEYKDEAEWVKVVDFFPERHRYLEFEDTIQGILDLDFPERPVLEYVGLMAAAARLLCPNPDRALLGGLGSCALLHAVRGFWPSSTWIRCVEESERVIELAQRFFRLPSGSHLIQGDLRQVLEREELQQLDCALIDCFGARNMPPHLMTLEFVFLVRRALASNGLALFNIWKPDCNPVCWNQVRTYLEVFGQVGLIRCRVDSNWILVLPHLKKVDFPASLDFAGRPYPLETIQWRFRATWPRELLGMEPIEDPNLHQFIKIIHEKGPP